MNKLIGNNIGGSGEVQQHKMLALGKLALSAVVQMWQDEKIFTAKTKR